LEIIRDQLISVSSHGLLVVHNNFELNVSALFSLLPVLTNTLTIANWPHRRTRLPYLPGSATKIYALSPLWQHCRRIISCCLGVSLARLSSWLSNHVTIMWLSCDFHVQLGYLVSVAFWLCCSLLQSICKCIELSADSSTGNRNNVVLFVLL